MENQNLNNEMVIVSPIIEKYIFARRLDGEKAREVYDEVVKRAKNFKNVNKDVYFEFNEKTGEINGSNLVYGVLINSVLKEEKLWIPTIKQAKHLDSLGKLTNEVYRDYGIAVYNKENPNSELAEKLLDESEKRGLKTPLLVPFKALKLDKNGEVSFGEDISEIMTGEEAVNYLKTQFNFKAGSGVRRLNRDRDDNWFADWGYLTGSVEVGRVDWICGEATTQNIFEDFYSEKQISKALKSADLTGIEKLLLERLRQ